MKLKAEPIEKTLKMLDEEEINDEENTDSKKYKTTKECFENLDEDDKDEIYDIFNFVYDDPRSLLELVETNPMKYISVVEHDVRCRELNLPIWTRRINNNLFIKFKVSKNSPPIEVGFSETCDDTTILDDLKTSIKYWLTYDDNQLSIQRRNIALLGNDQHETLSKVGQNDSLIPSNIDSILSKNDEINNNKPKLSSNPNLIPNINPILNINHKTEINPNLNHKTENKTEINPKLENKKNLKPTPERKHKKDHKTSNIKSQTTTVTVTTTNVDGTMCTTTTTTTNTYD